MKIDDATADEPGAFGTSWWCWFVFLQNLLQKKFATRGCSLVAFFSFIDKDKMTQ